MVWILLGYMFLFLHRPFEVWPVLATLHLERIYMLGTMLAVAFYPAKQWIPNRLHWAFLGFAAAVLLCWLASPWLDQGQLAVENYFKVLVFYALMILVVSDERGLRRLLLGFLAIMFVYMAHSLWEYSNGRHAYRMGIVRMIGVDEALRDPNSLGASIVYVLPLVVPFWAGTASRPLRFFLGGHVALSVVCIALTGSRSALLGLLLWVLMAVGMSRRRWRLAALVLLATPLLWAVLPAPLQNRFTTIADPEVGPKAAQLSAQGRVEGLLTGIQLWMDYPVTGCGPGVWQVATGKAAEAHNLYGQVVGEMGSVGALAFAAVLVALWLNIRHVQAAYRRHPEWGHDFIYYLVRAIGLTFVLLLFEGMFSHNLFRYNWLWYGGFLVMASHVVAQRLQSQEAARDLLETEPCETLNGEQYAWIGTRT